MSNILKSKTKQFQNLVKSAPKKPGCYIYKDKNGEVIYVGKAKVLLNRIKSYFANYKKLDAKTQLMIKNAKELEFVPVDTEVEALILENNLIKKYHPKYNIMMRDDKSYVFVKFEKYKNGKYDFPRIRIVREKKEDGAEYFGPYPNSVPLKNILKRIRKIFPYASCNRRLIQVSEDPLKVDTNNSKPCLYYHLGLCNAPCASLENKKDYLKNFNNIKKFFRGEKLQILDDLQRKMEKAAKSKDFEAAAEFRDKIEDIKYVTANIRIDNSIDDVLIEQQQERQRRNAVNDLIERLNFPENKLKNHKYFRIECYDISNIQGTNATGSMVVMIDGESTPRLYRRFRIRMKNEPNDFAMMQEVLARRFNNLVNVEKAEIGKNLKKRMKSWKKDESFSQKPDLIILDGGKGQLTAVYKVLEAFNLQDEIPVVGLAKREEEIFKMKEQFANGKLDLVENKFSRIKLPKRSESLYLVQRIRDEAHRFAKSYHVKLRNRGLKPEL
jgi:excinuclease ABC subunit C